MKLTTPIYNLYCHIYVVIFAENYDTCLILILNRKGQ